MISLVGKYAYVKQENLVEFYKSLNVPEAFVDKLIPKINSLKEFKVDGYKVTITGNYEATYILDKEVDETNEYNYTLKSIAKMEGNKLIVTSRTPEQPNTTLKRVYESNDRELIITMSCQKTPVIAKYYYRRVLP
ncbi:uncharacterized protein LOC123293472 [Chrysoperla carnea]|uniref:uncharacterized protein LOC123293472 n=1 Tax=Chrysoperla carnea TaxID=189513 RepID=UPI001D06A64D|nr:uncharacterized protein LOC123293472 [Chrysoperla carnea]